jgi:phosphoribosylformimino-5-aminoimidazole carboxamide ribotide isomerase
MIIIPALFIQNGKVVSLYKGSDNSEKKIYSKAPKSFARHFNKAGAEILFCVDLDGDQERRLPEIREAFSGEIWWAGQVRSLEKIQSCLDNGATRVVLGSSAEPIFKAALAQFGPKQLIAGLQVTQYEEVPEHCQALYELGFKDIIVKDLNAEGTLLNANYDLIEKCNYFSDANIFASGGVGEKRHLQLLERAGAKGALVARALYEGRIDLG